MIVGRARDLDLAARVGAEAAVEVDGDRPDRRTLGDRVETTPRDAVLSCWSLPRGEGFKRISMNLETGLRISDRSGNLERSLVASRRRC
jgi:hypothetical protein